MILVTTPGSARTGSDSAALTPRRQTEERTGAVVSPLVASP